MILLLPEENIMPSSVVANMLYDPVTGILKILFVSGHEYEYYKVPEREYRSMKRVKSKGTYLNAFIKKKYAYKKIK